MPDVFRNDESYDKQSVDAPPHSKPYPVGMSRRTANRNRVWNPQPLKPPVQPEVWIGENGAYKLVLEEQELSRVFNRIGAIAEFATLTGMSPMDVDDLFRKAEEAYMFETSNSKGLEDSTNDKPDVEAYIYTVEHTRHFTVKAIKPSVLAEIELLYSIPDDAKWEIDRSSLYTSAWTVNVYWVEKFNELPKRISGSWD